MPLSLGPIWLSMAVLAALPTHLEPFEREFLQLRAERSEDGFKFVLTLLARRVDDQRTKLTRSALEDIVDVLRDRVPFPLRNASRAFANSSRAHIRVVCSWFGRAVTHCSGCVAEAALGNAISPGAWVGEEYGEGGEQPRCIIWVVRRLLKETTLHATSGQKARGIRPRLPVDVNRTFEIDSGLVERCAPDAFSYSWRWWNMDVEWIQSESSRHHTFPLPIAKLGAGLANQCEYEHVISITALWHIDSGSVETDSDPPFPPFPPALVHLVAHPRFTE